MRHLTALLSAVALVGLGACATGTTNLPNRAPGWVNTRAQSGSQLEKEVAGAATGAQAGTILSVDQNHIVIDPFQNAAGNADIKMLSNTTVFQGQNKMGQDALRPGMPVDVYFSQDSSGKPQALGVKILSDQEAGQLKAEVQGAPNKG